MMKNKKLSEVAFYVKDRIEVRKLDLTNYVTTDNLLQNKQGKIDAENLPPNTKSVTCFQEKDILIANIRPYLKKIWFSNQKGGSSSDVLTIRVKEENHSEFLYYSLFRDDFFDFMMDNAKGTKMPRGDKERILDFPIPCFSPTTQKSIAKVLLDLDAKIETNNKINAKLEATAKLIYDYWFVQFDFPNTEGKPYKSSGGKMEYNEQLKREIPEGWEVGSLVDIADFTNGLGCQKFRPKENEDFLNVIKIREMRDGFDNNTEKVSVNIPDSVIVNSGDILFSWSASLVVMMWVYPKGGLNQHIFKVTSEKYPKSFYFFELKNYLEHFQMMAEKRKTTMGHITKSHLEQSRISIPPKEIINKIQSKLNSIFNSILINSQENQHLSDLRDWLLPMLMNGQVEVRKA